MHLLFYFGAVKKLIGSSVKSFDIFRKFNGISFGISDNIEWYCHVQNVNEDDVTWKGLSAQNNQVSIFVVF